MTFAKRLLKNNKLSNFNIYLLERQSFGLAIFEKLKKLPIRVKDEKPPIREKWLNFHNFTGHMPAVCGILVTLASI